MKTTAATTVVPGSSFSYSVIASNVGLTSANGTVVTDPIPTGITGFTWTCSASGGAVCPSASGTGALNQTIATFPMGGAVTYTITATVSNTPPASIANTATAVPPAGGSCGTAHTAPPCTSTVVVPPVPVVTLNKSTTATTITPSGTVTYTIAATNTGSVSAAGTVISDPLPAGIASATWTCAGTGGAVCPAASGSGALNQTLATFPAGSAITYTLVATVSATPPASINNTATATIPGGGLCGPGNTASPCTSSAPLPSVPVVQISKSASPTSPLPGGALTYTVTATNTGSVSAAGTVISDPLPAGITSATWTCAGTGGAVCPNASGTGSVSETLATFPAGSAVTYTLTATLTANPPSPITNTATAAVPGGLCAPGNTAPPCTSTINTTPVPIVSVAKTANVSTITPGGTVLYTVTVTNTGSSAAGGTVVSDPQPAGFTSVDWTCAGSSGAVCPAASGSGAINQTIATFPGGGVLTYAITAVVAAAPPASIINTASVTPGSGGLCAPGNTPAPCTSSAPLPSVPIVQINKTSTATLATPNGSALYTIVATNTGTVAATGTVISDPMPAGIVAYSWTCTASGGALCPNATGTGALNETVATFPAGSSLTYALTAAFSANPPSPTTNTASVTPSAGGLCAPGNTPPPCTGTVPLASAPIVQINKTVTPTSLVGSGTVTYTIVATNAGQVAATNTVLADPIPSGISAYSWTCAATSGAVCPNASGSGAVNETIVSFPVGSSLTYTVTASTNLIAGSITNTATLTPAGIGFCLPGATPAPCAGSASVTIAMAPPVPVPVNSWLFLSLLSSMVIGMAVAARKKRREQVFR